MAVLDSGIYIASVGEEELTSHAIGLIQHLSETNTPLDAPTLVRYEMASAVRKNVYRKLIRPETATVQLDLLLRFDITLHYDEMLVRRAYELAVLLNRPTVYDMQYLALAERLAVPFWTYDLRLYNAAHETFDWVHWLGSFEMPDDV